MRGLHCLCLSITYGSKNPFLRSSRRHNWASHTPKSLYQLLDFRFQLSCELTGLQPGGPVEFTNLWWVVLGKMASKVNSTIPLSRSLRQLSAALQTIQRSSLLDLVVIWSPNWELLLETARQKQLREGCLTWHMVREWIRPGLLIKIIGFNSQNKDKCSVFLLWRAWNGNWALQRQACV